MTEAEQVLIHCLYFTSNRFARNMTKLAEQTFDFSDLAPSYLYMVMLIHEHPNITQKELCERLSIAPSTSTRFIDKLVKKGYVLRAQDGKETNISLTADGEALHTEFRQGLRRLFERYSAIIGEDVGRELSNVLAKANTKLEAHLTD